MNKLNLPNRLSLLRILLIPLMVGLFYFRTPVCDVLAVVVFAAASFTDFLDGYIARSRNLITTFGRFIDPVADKLLVLSALIMLVYNGLMTAWVVVTILARELCVDGLRMVAVSRGKVISAGPLGKLKTVSQIILVLYLMIFRIPVASHWVGIVLTGWVLVITIWSGVDYFIRNGSCLSEGESEK